MSLLLSAQTVTIKGKILDKKSTQPLAFVNIISEDGRLGAVSDIDGKFRISLPVKTCCLKLSYIGYKPLVYKTNYIITM